jgi:putative hydroxymethylpyrimidine transport system substrate-binding protein
MEASMFHARRALAALFLAALTLAGSAAEAQETAPPPTEKLTVLLDWFVNPDHAPLVIAKERGLFAAQNLEVELIAPADPAAPPRLVAAGEADIAISYQPNLYLQVAEGLPVVRIGTLVATPLNALVVDGAGPIATLADLEGETIGYSVAGFEDALLGAMLATVGLGLDDVELVNVNFALTPALLSGRVAGVIGAFRNFELTQIALEGREGRAFYPEEHGVPVYDELIFIARRDDLGRDALARFLAAVEEAVLWQTNHPEAALAVFLSAHPDLDDALNRQAFADTLRRFALRPAALDRGRYERFAAFMQAADLIDEVLPIDRYAAVIR